MNLFVRETDGTEKNCLVNGLSIIAGGTGIADLVLGAPQPGAKATIRLASITSGTVVVTCAAGTSVDGTNNTMTFDTAEEGIDLVYKDHDEWAIARNEGVALSAV
jgi:hypothetical protein